MRENLPAHQLDPRIKKVWRLSDALWIVLLAAVCIVPFGIAATCGEEWAAPIVLTLTVIAVVLLIVFVVVLPPVRYARWRYELTDDYLDIARGIFWRKRFIIPFIRVQNTDTRQGPILRAFGLASVTVATAAGEHAIPGLGFEEAEILRDRAAELARIAREDV